ncbi:hypothetical protein Hdeb2414_s0288g00858031 [Helianthus debilis subsp. tardiflorus]
MHLTYILLSYYHRRLIKLYFWLFNRLSRRKHTKIYSDFGDDEETEDILNSKKSSFKSKRARKRLAEDSYEQLDDEPLNLLDREKTRLSLRSFDSLKRKLRSDDEPEIDADGRLVISEEEKGIKREVTTGTGSDSDVRSVAIRKTKKRRKTVQSGWAYTGSEYSSKKAGGDLKRKGKFEPYAYWPLDRKMVSRRPEHRLQGRACPVWLTLVKHLYNCLTM